MKKATLVIAMVSSNLADLMGPTRPRSSQHLHDTPNNKPDPTDTSRVESQLTSDPMTNTTDFNKATNATP
jgi:hypothetical protein